MCNHDDTYVNLNSPTIPSLCLKTMSLVSLRWERSAVSVLLGVQVELRDRRGRPGDRLERGLPEPDRIGGFGIGVNFGPAGAQPDRQQVGEGGQEVNENKC